MILTPAPKNPTLWFRGNDLFINAYCSSKNKNNQLDFYYYKKFPDNITFDRSRVEQLKKLFNRFPTRKITVPLLSSEELFSAINRKFCDVSNIHLLSIDTEGFEESILEISFP